MKVRLPEFLPASAVVLVVAVLPFAVFWMPFQVGLWAVGSALVAIVAALVGLGRRDTVQAVRNSPHAVRLGLTLYVGAAAYGAVLGLVLGNPIRYVVSQTASMAILPASFIGFRTGSRPSLRRLATGLGLGSMVALGVHVGFLVLRAGGPAVTGEALRLTLPHDISFIGTAVMAFLAALVWWAEARSAFAAGAVAASGCLLVGSMSRGAWLVSLGGFGLLWLLSRRRRWWTLALLASAPLACVAVILGASGWVWGHGRPLVASRVDFSPQTLPDSVIEIERDVPVTGGPIELTFGASGPWTQPPVLVVKARDGSGNMTSLAALTPNPSAPSEDVRSVHFPPIGVIRLDFLVRQAGGDSRALRLEARELPGALAGWVRTLGLRLRTIGTAITKPAEDDTMQYRLSEWAAVRRVWLGSSPTGWLIGRGLGATVEFPNSSWDAQGHRVLVPTSSYLHNFYVFLGFKLGLAGIAALAGLLMVVGWTCRVAWSARSTGGSLPLAAAAACWCAYLAWSVTSPEIINAHTATLLGALVAASLADAAHHPGPLPQAASRSQSSSMRSA
ncbi:MAG: O-antigen ligase family protein [Acidobacteriia bacterium]|nr:O-antigen ligase family protein [Terriglobia bacterium]